jgi:hypothetical protein
MTSGKTSAEPMAPRRQVLLTQDQAAWVAEQPGSLSDTLRALVDAAISGALRPADEHARDVLVTALALLDERGSWLRGSPGELLEDLRAGEATAMELVDEVCQRMRPD